MPPPPGITRRHRWFIGVIVALLVAPMLLLWSPLPLPFALVFIALSLPALLIWIAAGQSWVWAAGPPRQAGTVDRARQVGRRIMVLLFVFRLTAEVLFWAFGARDQGAGEVILKAVVTGAVLAFAMGKMADVPVVAPPRGRGRSMAVPYLAAWQLATMRRCLLKPRCPDVAASSHFPILSMV